MQRKRQGAQHCFAYKRILSLLLCPGSHATPTHDIWSLHWQRSALNLRDSQEKQQRILIQRHNPGHCWNLFQFTKLFFFFAQKHKMDAVQTTGHIQRIGSRTASDQTALWMHGCQTERPTLQKKEKKEKRKKKEKTPALEKTWIFSISTPSHIYQFQDDKSNLTVLRQTWCLGMC